MQVLAILRQRPLLAASVGLAFLLAAAWFAGLVVFLRSQSRLSFTFPVLEAHPRTLHNLALYRYGTAVRVSSYDVWSDSQHHPGFLVDDLKGETIEQKWATLRNDAVPWVELRWNQPAKLERIQIRHAGANEDNRYTARKYTMTCLLANGKGSTLEVTNNERPESSHELPCEGATGVRLAFWPNAKDDVVRVFEIQAWGSPGGAL
jgi:hypothetical protein